MAFLVSPAVSVTEVDLSNIIPNVATSTAGTAGQFSWGPVEEITLIANEEELVNVFGKPKQAAYKDFLCSASFLAYAADLRVVRVVHSTALNASAQASGIQDSNYTAGLLIKNQAAYDVHDFTSSLHLWLAKYPGVLGDSLGVAWANTAGFNAVDSNGDPTWIWHSLFTDAPDTNQFHIVVYDADGGITGSANSALERFAFVSSVSTDMNFDGTTAYVKEVINRQSAWVLIGKTSLLTGTSNGVDLAGGNDGSAVTEGDRETGLALFADVETVDVSLIFAAGAGTTASKWIIDNLAETRRDCIALVSPMEADVVNATSSSVALTNIKATRTIYGSSSYVVMDSAYKLMYDRYNDVNRWVPLNGDIAGLCARTDADTDPWFSPAGLNRGRIKNAIKLSILQPLDIRDELYKTGVNPCVAFPLEGPVLFGDKTLQSKPSAFDRINVRRLFIVLEKAIATSAKFMLFEQNDDFTRARFVNMVEPFLRDVQGRRGIIDFRVVCDSTNNTAQVIDSNEFVADIYIKPTRSINYIRLNFVAVRSGTSFDEIVQGQ